MAEMQNTGNPLPSNDLKDLNDNLIVLDRQLNSEELTTTDRFGNVIPTVAGMRKTMEDLASQIATNELVPIDGSRAADKLTLKDGDSTLEIKSESGELKVGDKTALVALKVGGVREIDEATNFKNLKVNGSDVISKAMNGAYITETFLSSDGLSWYRVWSNGTIEQGGMTTGVANSGATTVNLLKPFSDMNYILFVQPITVSADFTKTDNASFASVTNIAGSVANRTLTNFQIGKWYNTMWYARGNY